VGWWAPRGGVRSGGSVTTPSRADRGRGAATRARRAPDAVDTAPRRPVDTTLHYAGPLRPRRPTDGPAVRYPASGRLHRLRVAAAVASALVFLLTAVAWGLYRDVTAGMTTTDVIAGGGDGGPLDILLVGVDSRTDTKGNPLPPEVLEQLHTGSDNPRVLNSDTIILLHVPEDGGAATAFSIPRDAYVPIPGYRTDKINAAYPAVQALTAERLIGEGVRDRDRIDADATQAGRIALIGAVQQLTGVTVDHFAEVNLLGFYNLTRAIGGVEVCLKAPVDDLLSGARFPAGPRTVSGADALAFVRQRHGLPEGDLSRIRRQQVFLAAVAAKILSGDTLTDPAKLRGLIGVAHQSVVLDRGWDLLAFARQGSGIAAGNIAFDTVPTQGIETNARGRVVRVDPGQVRAFVERRSAEQEQAARRAREAAQTPAPATPEPPPPLDVEAGHYVVHVRNGSGTSGLASQVRERLTGFGFVRGTVDNTAETPTSVVRHRDSPDAADAVAAQLGGFEVEQDDTVASGHLQVVLGADAPTLIPGLPTPAPPPATTTAAAAEQPITAAGAPCVD
jgi:LCP family protein required for cell wall assembly